MGCFVEDDMQDPEQLTSEIREHLLSRYSLSIDVKIYWHFCFPDVLLNNCARHSQHNGSLL